MLNNLIHWTPEKLRQWETIRTQGKRQFVVRRGIFWFGGFMFVFMTAWMSAFMLRGSRSVMVDLLVLLLINAIIWPIAGFMWGLWTWSLAERAYGRYQRQQHGLGTEPMQSASSKHDS
jgi:hypothetical protein